MRIEQRPMHTDEAVHAVKFNELWTTGRYVYDPQEFHGPLLYYATLPVVWLSGAQDFADTREATFRVVPVIFGVGLILLLLLVADGLGRGTTLIAGVLTAVSPALVFYSPYYIQETLLAFFTFAVVASGWRYARTRRAVWAIAAGAGLGLMHATKETCIIAFGCLAAALLATLIWRRREETGGSVHQRPWRPVVFGVALVVGAGLSVLFYSGLLTHARGPLDSILTYWTYFDRAGGHGLHDHPGYYYLRMLAFSHFPPGPRWSEGLILLLALVGLVAVGTRRVPPDASLRFLRFIAIYGVLMAVAYSAIPYKTPWCLLQFLQPLILLAGVGAVALLRWLRPLPVRVGVGLLLAAGMAHLGWQAWRASDWFHIGYRNPYVYSQPLSGVVRLSTWVERLAPFHPDGHRMLIKVIADDSWPLPWYLRRFERVGYWEQPPADPDAPVVIVAGDLVARLPARFSAEEQYQVNPYGLRPDVWLAVYVERELYERFAAWQKSPR